MIKVDKTQKPLAGIRTLLFLMPQTQVKRKMFHPTTITHGQPVEDVLQSVCGNSGKSFSASFFGVYMKIVTL